ncbi:MAG: hypothetical protein AB1599_08380, partial [Planctomycetota bacterium]
MNKFGYILLLLAIFSYSSELLAESRNTLSEEQIKSLSSARVPFIKNEGQMPEEIKFYIQTFNGTVLITDKGELVYTIVNQKD